ncbi:MAG: HAMP domain-containing sensor histidine kinase [Bacteroidia bacterium]
MVYVLIQFSWWTYLLVKLNTEVIQLQTQLVFYTSDPGEALTVKAAEEALETKLHKQWLMIFGEGSVFLILLMLGIFKTRNSFRQEAAIAKRQKNFLLSVTHELKSPIASAKLQLETIQKRELPKDKQDELISGALEDTERLHVLVENILLAARIDDHSFSVFPESTALQPFLEELIQKAQKTYARHHRLKFNSSFEGTAAVDKMTLHSIVVNLIENACKYSPKGSEIILAIKEHTDKITIECLDNGAGIPDAEKQKVFERFYRIGNEETRSAKGTGLGLYIVKNLVDAHHWKIEVKDNPAGGTIFALSIPKHTPEK